MYLKCTFHNFLQFQTILKDFHSQLLQKLKPTYFFAISDDVERLKSLYSDVDDIDLYVGGFLERRHTDSILGPVFKCIIADTFARLKIGDRFFYDLGLDQRTMFLTSFF